MSMVQTKKEIKKYWEERFNTSRRTGKYGLETFSQKISIKNTYNIFRTNILNNVKGGMSVLELGCGLGTISDFLIKEKKVKKLICTDISKEAIENCNKKGLNAFIADAENLKFNDNSFDIVCGFALLHHLNNPKRAIEEACRVSKKFVFFHEPNKWNPIRFLTERFLYPDYAHETSYSILQYYNWFKNTDFKIKIVPNDFLIPYISNRRLTEANVFVDNVLKRTPLKFIAASLNIIGKRCI